MKQKSHELLESGAVTSVLAWKQGDLAYSSSPTLFNSSDELDSMHYDGFCGSNLSKYLINQGKSDGKTLIFLKPCDTYSLNQLLGEQRVNREKVHAIGIGCKGKLDINKLNEQGIKGILEIIDDGEKLKIKTLYGDKTCERKSILLEKCLNCKGKEHKIYDELIGDELSTETSEGDRLSQIIELEDKTPDERFAFWRGELSKCIRCNACRDICPACTCNKCVFENPQSGIAGKVNTTEFEENLYHIIRGYHVAGRCSDCGECTRVCPQSVPLHLINRKFIKDMNTFYGEFQAGEAAELNSPLLRFDFDDIEPKER
ncbi:MAG: 4Fe-4S dicluster domain-containing protein [Oscillospiraceae bacterium]|nr:4Fe-4S dicluster domain-containing protein [Oscillospiraceae bacterium]MCL2249972.1 4Fe-4S dicluster domain-containing protein [Oscillospiraceae bacterium]